MAHKCYYLLLVCLIGCLIAAILISQRVDRSSTIEPESQASEQRASQEDELEERTHILIDLVESGKTFAYTKLRVQVRVPKSSPHYVQRPSFLDHKPDSDQSTATEEHMSPKYVLSRTMIDASGEPDLPTVATAPSIPGETITASADTPVMLDSLELDIKPVETSVANVALEELLFERQQSDSNSTGRHKRDLESQLMDGLKEPLELVASELNVRPQSINVTFVDCFLVDTDKRYDQRIMFEDRYRQVASTRRVSFATLMAIITSCRKLTWASLPNVERSQWTNAASSRNHSSTVLARSLDQPTSSGLGRAPVQDLLGSLLSTWLPDGAGLSDHRLPAETRSTWRARSTSLARQAEAPANSQASYLNMGLSMVSGIVPNTLWCGLGDRAANYSELGAEHRVDSCCRAHDHCPIRIKAFTADYGLVNWSVSTRSHCDCDLDFNDCLMAVNSTLSNVIRVLYFRFVGVQCIDVDGRQRSPSVQLTQASI